MRTFSYNVQTEDYAARVLECMEKNKGYIYYFNGKNTPEAYQRIFLMAMKSENRLYTDLTPYIKVLARNIMKQKQREVAYAPFDEEGEVAFVFTPLVSEDKYGAEEDKERVDMLLQELYLRSPEDFIQLKQLIPATRPSDVKPIKNKEMALIIKAMRQEFGARLVFQRILVLLAELTREKAAVINAEESRQIPLKVYDPATVDDLTDKQWLKDKYGKLYGIDKSTLYMEDGFNPELSQFRLAIPTNCTIWKLDMSEILADIEEKIYAETGVDNEYICWCKGSYMLVTPAGCRLQNSRDSYMEAVRKEIILAVLNSGVGSIIALSPDNIYLKLTRATSLVSLQLKADNGKVYILPMSMQEVVKVKH